MLWMQVSCAIITHVKPEFICEQNYAPRQVKTSHMELKVWCITLWRDLNHETLLRSTGVGLTLTWSKL